MNIKIEEAIAHLAWSTAYKDGIKDAPSNASEAEKGVVRAFRKFYDISIDRFNELISVDKNQLISELAKQDPVYKLIGIYTCVAVAHAETEEVGSSATMSDKEWDFILKIIQATGISNSVREAVRKYAKNLVEQITNIELLDEDELMLDLLKMEIESGTFAEKYITPLLTIFFDTIESENELIRWEENYLALKRNKRALTKTFGEFSIKKWDSIYEDLKFNIKELKKSSALFSSADKIISDLEKEKLKQEKTNIKIAEKEKLKQEKANNKIAEQEKLNKTHEISSSHGIMYCRSCGKLKDELSGWDCRREQGHKYSVKKVEVFSYDSRKEFEYKPVCSKCGKVGMCSLNDWCR
jgi:hypothetical protein